MVGSSAMMLCGVPSSLIASQEKVKEERYTPARTTMRARDKEQKSERDRQETNWMVCVKKGYQSLYDEGNSLSTEEL